MVMQCSYARVYETSDAGNAQARARQARERAVSRVTAGQQTKRSRESWTGEDAAIYCRVSHIKDKDQTSVDRQERICRGTCGEPGPGSAACAGGPEPFGVAAGPETAGLGALLKVARDREIRHIVVYRPERPMRQPWDLEELLKISEEHGIILHGKASHRDLS